LARLQAFGLSQMIVHSFVTTLHVSQPSGHGGGPSTGTQYPRSHTRPAVHCSLLEHAKSPDALLGKQPARRTRQSKRTIIEAVRR
jgi:hypothetical protein